MEAGNQEAVNDGSRVCSSLGGFASSHTEFNIAGELKVKEINNPQSNSEMSQFDMKIKCGSSESSTESRFTRARPTLMDNYSANH